MEEKRILDILEKIEEENARREKYVKKQYRLTQLSTIACLGMFLVLLCIAIVFVPKFNTMLNNFESVMYNIQVVTDELAAADINGMLKNVDSFVSSSEKNMSAAMDRIMAIDIETLNQAIQDLSNVVRPLSSLFAR